MNGTCPDCLTRQQELGMDYTCVLCVIQQSGIQATVTKRKGQPTVIDLAPRPSQEIN